MKVLLRLFFALLFVIHARPLCAQEAEPIRSKCGFPAFVDRMEQARGNMALRKKNAAAPSLETSRLSPSGHFRIHFDTSAASANRPALLDGANQRMEGTHDRYVDSVARIFDHVWDVEIGSFGFPAPPGDNGDGGGNEYDIYIESMTDYGVTSFMDPGVIDPVGTAPRYASYISIHRDYGVGFTTKGLAGARVTAAHEFFHAIQLGGFGWWGSTEQYYYELMAESMEPAVYPDLKDYIKDAKPYFASINQMSLTQNSSDAGYSRTVWAIYFRLKYGIDFIRTAWENARRQSPPIALLSTVEQYGSTMRKELSEFAMWCYYTNTRADSIHYFPDAKLLPSVKLADSIWLASPSYSHSTTCPAYTIQYLWMKLALDTSVCVIVNANSDDANAHTGRVFSYTVDAGQQTGADWKPLSSSMNFRLTVGDPSVWNAFSLSHGTWMSVPNASPYPDPFHPGTGTLAFPLPSAVNAPVEVTILDAALRSVNQWNATPQSQMGIWQVAWDGRDQRGSLVSTGIYFYFIRSNNFQQQGKIAVLR